MATTNDLKNGLVLDLDGQLWSVVQFQHVKPGKGGAFVRTTLKNVLSGKVVDRTFNAGTKVETATVDKRSMTYLYREGDDFVFMDSETYEQVPVPAGTVGDGAGYLLENTEVVVAMHDGTPLYVELPTSVELVIEQTDPGLQGDRSTGGTKPATLETGATIQVPLFVSTGEKVKVDTRDGRYLGRQPDGRPEQGPQARGRRALRGGRPRRRPAASCWPSGWPRPTRRCRTTRSSWSRASPATWSGSTGCSASTPRAGRSSGCRRWTGPCCGSRCTS